MTVKIRPAEARDSDALGRMGAALCRLHHDFDRRRFMLPEDVEDGYRWWLTRERQNPSAVVLVAEKDGEAHGYCYGRLEGRDWNKLLDGYGEVIDLWVDDELRRSGAGGALVEAMVERLTTLGAPRIVLMTASKNQTAQRLFARLGFRSTMIELTRDVPVKEG